MTHRRKSWGSVCMCGGITLIRVFLAVILFPLSLVLLCIFDQSLALLSLPTPIERLQMKAVARSRRTSPPLAFCGLSKPSSVSLTSYIICPSPLNIVLTPCWNALVCQHLSWISGREPKTGRCVPNVAPQALKREK